MIDSNPPKIAGERVGNVLPGITTQLRAMVVDFPGYLAVLLEVAAGNRDGYTQCTFLSSQLRKNLAMPVLFFSDMNWWPLPGSPTSSSLTKVAFTPA